MTEPEAKYPGVFIEETHTTVKVIPGVSTSPSGIVSTKMTPKKLLAAGYKIIDTSIQSGGLALLLGKGADLVLVRMTEYRDGSSVEGQLVVTFAAKVP
jgi:hypothetical protein